MYDLDNYYGENAFAILGYVKDCMREVGFSHGEIETYTKKATSADYEYLVSVSEAMVDTCNEMV